MKCARTVSKHTDHRHVLSCASLLVPNVTFHRSIKRYIELLRETYSKIL